VTPLGIEHATFWLVAQSQWVTGEIPSGIKQPGDEAGHSPPSNAKVMNKQSYTSSPPICLNGTQEQQCRKHISDTKNRLPA